MIGHDFPYVDTKDLNLDWLLKNMKKIIQEWANYQAEMNQSFSELNEAFSALKSWVENYFVELDVQQEINNKIDSMIESGELEEILQPIISSEVSDWLADHITNPSSPPVDTSLTVSGAAADAKVTGDKITDINNIFGRESAYVNEIALNKYISRFTWDYGFISGGVITKSIVSNVNRYTPNLYLLPKGTVIRNNYTGETRYNVRIWLYDADGTNLNQSIVVVKNASVELFENKWCRLNLEIDTDDATTTFDPNKFVTAETPYYPDIIGAVQVPQIVGGYIDKYGTLHTEYAGNIYTDFVECNPGDVFVFRAKSTNADLPVMLKYDSNEDFERVIIPGNLTFRWFTVPISDAGYVRFSNVGLDNALLAYRIPAEKRANIGFSRALEKIPAADEVAGFYNASDSIEGAETWHSKINEFDCNAGEVYHYFGNNGANAVGAIFYNSEDIVGHYTKAGSMGLDTQNITIPEGCNHVKFCSANVVANKVYLSVVNVNEKALSGNQVLPGLKWCAIGDSITAGDGNDGRSYVEMISEETGIIGFNKGYGGSGYYNGAGGSNQFYNRLTGDGIQYDIYTVMGSVNDGSVTLGEITDTGTDTLGGCMNATIQAIYTQNPAAKIAIISPTSAGNAHFGYDGAWKAYVDFQKDFCRYNAIPYLDLTACDNLRPWDDTFNDSYFYHNPNVDPNHGDRTHPNENGYKFFIGQIRQFLESVAE